VEKLPEYKAVDCITPACIQSVFQNLFMIGAMNRTVMAVTATPEIAPFERRSRRKIGGQRILGRSITVQHAETAMNTELLAHWSDYDSAVRKILPLATRSLRIFDPDLEKLRLESRENALVLRRFLAAAPCNTLRIVLRCAEPFRRDSPRLFKLLTDFPHAMEVWECAPQLTRLTDAMLLSDDCHALIRIHQDHARSRLIIGDAQACRGYFTRFDDILAEGGTPISATTLGL
jgi:hypothetical protein